jgi:hypothetical protein
MKSVAFIYLTIILCFTSFATGQEQVLATLTVQAGESDRINTPVGQDLQFLTDETELQHFCLFEITDNQRVPVPFQIEQNAGQKLWWILSGTTHAGSSRTFVLVAGRPQINVPLVHCALDSFSLILQLNGKNILQYHHAMVEPPPGAGPLFRRNGFIHPLWSPDGSVLTESSPPDHIHHMGIWSAWTKTIFAGKAVDFWNLGEGQGTVRFVKFLSITDGPVYGGFTALHGYYAFFPEGEKKALDEQWDVRVWNTSADTSAWLWDLTSFSRCASDSSLLLEAYRYGGGIGFRATSQWTRENCTVLTSEGLGRAEADGSKARWCIIMGTNAKGGKNSALFLSHPDNREYPEPMRVWPEDSNNGRGDMFFEFCPIRHNSWTMEPGKDYELKYRVVSCEGSLDATTAERYWHDFARPPQVTVKIN